MNKYQSNKMNNQSPSQYSKNKTHHYTNNTDRDPASQYDNKLSLLDYYYVHGKVPHRGHDIVNSLTIQKTPTKRYIHRELIVAIQDPYPWSNNSPARTMTVPVLDDLSIRDFDTWKKEILLRMNAMIVPPNEQGRVIIRSILPEYKSVIEHLTAADKILEALESHAAKLHPIIITMPFQSQFVTIEEYKQEIIKYVGTYTVKWSLNPNKCQNHLSCIFFSGLTSKTRMTLPPELDETIEAYTERASKIEQRIITHMHEEHTEQERSLIRKAKRDSSVYCSFHKSISHNTSECVRRKERSSNKD